MSARGWLRRSYLVNIQIYQKQFIYLYYQDCQNTTMFIKVSIENYRTIKRLLIKRLKVNKKIIKYTK